MSVEAGGSSALETALLGARIGRPDAIRARWDAEGRESQSIAEIDALADHHAARWRETRQPEGARVLILGAPSPRTLAAIAGAHRAGLDVALAPPALEVIEIARAAVRAGATIVAGPHAFAGLPLAERLFAAAALNEDIRLVGVHGGSISGALALDGPLEEETSLTPPSRAASTRCVEIVDGGAISNGVEDAASLAFARDWRDRANIKPGDAIVSLLSLGTKAGFVAGALAPLLCGAHVIWQAPFAAAPLAEALDCAPRVHLLAPRTVAEAFLESRLIDPFRLASLTWLLGANASDAPSPPGLDPGRVFYLMSAPDGALAWRGA